MLQTPHQRYTHGFGDSRRRDRSLRLCFRTGHATFTASGSSPSKPLSRVPVSWLGTFSFVARAISLTSTAQPVAYSPAQGLRTRPYYLWRLPILSRLLVLFPLTDSAYVSLSIGFPDGLRFLGNPLPGCIGWHLLVSSESNSGVPPFRVIVCRCFRLVLYAGLLLV